MVQRCWFDGPKVDPPMDYQRLLPSQVDAERVALESAHSYGKQHQAVVRTILLPPTSQQGSLYAYTTAHVLFWVRKVTATVEIGLNNPLIHAVMNNGVIGGCNGRRGSEVTSGRVYGGPHSAQWALQTAQALQKQSIGGNNSYVTCLPTGLPTGGDDILSGWPDHASFQQSIMQDVSETSSKRSFNVVSDYYPSDTDGVTSMEEDEVFMVTRPAKRACSDGVAPCSVVLQDGSAAAFATATSFGEPNMDSSTVMMS